jgi:hypothetical protein
MGVAFDITTRRGREWVREVFTGRKVANLAPEEAKRAHAAGYEPDGDYLIGGDPRPMERAELEACRRWKRSERNVWIVCRFVRRGAQMRAITCPSWPLRIGKNPWRSVSDARRETGRRRAARMHQKSSEAK